MNGGGQNFFHGDTITTTHYLMGASLSSRATPEQMASVKEFVDQTIADNKV